MPYTPYTQMFDREVGAKDLDGAIGPLSHAAKLALEEAWVHFETGLAGWKTRTQIAALDRTAVIRSHVPVNILEDCCFSLLIDQSGSMRGQNMLLAAAAADCIQDFVRNLGCTVEVLGFTTTTWKGGLSRRKWFRHGRAPTPGRLCDLLHIIYMDANSPGKGTGSWAFRPMLRPDLPKENVDGEAVQWATDRLKRLKQNRKFLIIISDGAPVDDSTLMENDLDYLSRHLRSVVGEIEAKGEIRLSAIGIGHDVTSYYSDGLVVHSPDELGSALIGKVADLVISAADPG
ncbi:cobaltochelatase CobT-related protein [Asticcacaulis sp. MM231]|uniref:cobaltochelatase CobT-related protein n=1 Tax=Asticcacaulis sp. MM231 TaxID=3157666 RepID=UPI0032D598BF